MGWVCISEEMKSDLFELPNRRRVKQLYLNVLSGVINSEIGKSLIVQVQGWEPGTEILSFNPEWLLLILEELF